MVSIVSPVYNGEKYLRNCIEGVLKQTFRNFEYIILDNASTDGTAGIIDEYAGKDDRIKVFRNPETLRIIDNWNECRRYISPETVWVKYAFADDILFPNCVEAMVEAGERVENIGFVSSYHLRGRQVENVGLPIGQEVADGKSMLKQHILRKLHVCLNSPNTVMYKRAVLDELGGFDNAFFHADSELAFRILDKYDLGFVHQVLSWTGVNKHSGATYALFHGLITQDYLRFGYKDIGKYDGIRLTDEERRHLSRYYADEIARYVSTHIIHFRWKEIRNLWSQAPAEVKRSMFSAIKENWLAYLRKFVGSVIHYKANKSNRPTFTK